MSRLLPLVASALFFLFAAAPALLAQLESRSEPLIAGELVHVRSELLNEERPLTVQVPPGSDGTALDVLIVLDAENHGFHAAGVVDFLSHEYVSKLPATLVVGVINTDRLRDTTPSSTTRWPAAGGARTFVRFLAEELIPWIESRHSITGKITLVGHSGSGLAAMYALLDHPEAFSTLIVVDPSLDWDDGIFFRHAKAAWKRRPSSAPRLLLSSYKTKEWQSDLKTLIKKHGSRSLEWNLQMYDGETHGSMVHRAIYDALLTLGET